jgi:small subunit ribosomal protein S3
MGQKTHPKGFRLVTTQKHLSNWYSEESVYSSLIQEDFLIREKVEEVFNDLITLSNIEIFRTNSENELDNSVIVNIYALYPRAKETYRRLITYFTETKELEQMPDIIKYLKGNLKKFMSLVLHRNIRNIMRFLQIKTNKDFEFHFFFIRNRFEDANLIAKFIGDQLQKRVGFRKVLNLVSQKVGLSTMKGVKVEVSGRLGGAEIARSESKLDGKVPLHTLRAKIDYTHRGVETIYGIIGIKVWLYAN